MLDTHDWAAQPDSHLRIGIIEMCVIKRRLNNRVHRLFGWQGGRNKSADQKPGDGSVAIRKMKQIRNFCEILFELHPEAIEADRTEPCCLQRRHGIDALIVAPAVA